MEECKDKELAAASGRFSARAPRPLRF